MEDNELDLEYGINFNVKKGAEIATKEIQDYNTRWEEWLKKNPLKIHFDVIEGGGSAGNIKEKVRKTTEEVTGLKSEIADLEKQWAKLNTTQRKGDEGQTILNKYKNVTEQAGLYGKTLAGVTRTEEAQAKAQQAKIAADLKAQEDAKGLKAEISSLEKQWAKLDDTQRKSAEGQSIVGKYKDIIGQAGQFGTTLAGVTRAEEAQAKAQQAKIAADLKAQEAAKGLKAEILALERQWAKLNELQRKSPDGQRILREYQSKMQSAGQYATTLFGATRAQEAAAKAQIATEKAAAKDRERSQKQAIQMEKELQAAKMKTLNNTSRISDAYRNQGNIISNLKGLAAQYISIYATGRLIKNLTEVTGMFELQEKSLEAIIRNKQQADKIFSQTKALAIESPFQFKDLIGYVKQLSAYRVETDQLYDTMKNLADVSAGLGVDMNRIILAYGQVKSAAVLRGQELRQFTEAGIPLVQELADKFSELEKRTVSMNEVFSLISARQVPFEMVRDIFSDMTKEGGMFYNMQKIQAETLSGKISNLKDAFDIMFNSIGSNKEVNFILKGTVDAIMNMAKNWKIVGGAIFPLITAFGAYRLTMAGLVAIENIRLKQSAGMIKLYNGELLAISKKSAAERASIATSRSIILQDTLRNALEKEGIVARKASRIAYVEKIAMEKTGMNIGKVVIAQEALKAKLMESGISATRANAIAQRSYQAAVMGASTATKGLAASMKALFVSNPIGWITLAIGALISLGLTIANTIKEAKKLKKELESIGNSGATEMAALEKRYTALANIVRSTTKSELEKAKAMESLKNKYSEIIPASKLTSEYIRDEANSYQDAIRLIREYIVEKTKEKKISALDQDYDEKSNKYMSGMQKQLVKLGSDAESATMFVDELQRKLIELDIQDYSTSLDTTLKLMKDIYGYNLVDGRHLNANEQAHAVKFMKSYKDFFDKTKEYNNGIKSVLKEGATYYQENSKEYRKMLNDIEEAKLKFKQGNEKNGIKLTAYEFDRANAKIEQDHLIKYLTNTVKVAKDAMTKAVEEQDFRQIQTLMLDNFGKGLASKIQSLYPDKYTNEVNSYLLSNGIKNDRYLKKVNETPDDYTSALEDQKKVAETKLEELGRMNAKIRAEKVGFIDAIGEYRKANYEEEKTYWENELKAPKLFAEKYGKDWFEPKGKPTGGSADNTDYVLERIKREIEMMEQAKETYDDLVESGYSAVDAMIKTEELYKSKIGDYAIADTYEETLANYRKAIDNLKKRPKTGDDIFGMEKKILETQKLQTKKAIDDYIENINKTFENNKNRINLFDVLFESTGNYGLASMIAQDLYGKGGVQIKTALREAVKQSLVGTEINMSDIVDANDEIDLNKAFEAANKLTGSALQKSLLENLNSVREYKEKEIEEFYKGYEAFQDYEKRKSDVVMKEMKYRYDVSNSTLPDSEKSRLMGISEKREKEGVSKIELERFKESDTWLRAFGDLDKLSIESINRLKIAIKDYLETYRSELSATDLKTISDKLIELDEATTQIDLKQTFKDIFTKIDMTPFEESVNKAKADVLTLEEQVKTLQQKNTEANAAVKNKDGKDNEAEMIRQKQLADELADALERLSKARERLGIAEEDQNKASNTQTAGLEKLSKEVANVSGYMTKLKGAVDGVVDAFKESAESMGFDIGEETLAVIDGINAGLSASISIIGAVAAAIVFASSMVGKALLANPILLAIAGGIALIVGIVSTINKLSLDKHKKEMEAYTKKIEELDKAYQKLKDSGEYAFGDEMVKNRVSQINKANEMVLEAEKQFIAASRNYHEKRASGKGEDKAEEEMEEYKKRYEDAQKELAESKRQLAEDISGLDMGSAARDFADSWLDAYLEFGNTADAISGKFKDMIRNMVVNTILSKITDAFLKPIYTMIGDLSSDTDGLTSGDINTVLAKLESGIPALDATLTATAEGLGNALSGLRNTDNDLQGISKGIAGASEETVGLLAGYMESIRFRLFAYIDYMMLNSGTTTMSSLLAGQNTQIVHLASIDANTLRSAVANEELTKEVKKLITTSGIKGAYSLNVNI